MRQRDRRVARVKLDVEMWPYRKAAREKNPTNELLRAVRRALGIPIKEIMEEMGVGRSAVFDLEMRERKRTITLQSLGRMAEAMGCKVVYGVVPADGGTLEHMAEGRLWKAVLGKQGIGKREQGSGSKEFETSKTATQQAREFAGERDGEMDELEAEEFAEGPAYFRFDESGRSEIA